MKEFSRSNVDKQSWKSLNQVNHGSDNLVINNPFYLERIKSRRDEKIIANT
jgi:hypothetical protein